MNNPVTLYPARRKHAFLGFLSLPFVGVPFLAPGAPAVVWIGAVFFAVCALVFLLQLIPGASYLRLTEHGFVVRSIFRTWPLVPWCCVSVFRVTSVSGQQLVIYDNVVDATHSPRLAQANRWLTGSSSGLPDTYGLTAEALAALLNEWREGNCARSST